MVGGLELNRSTNIEGGKMFQKPIFTRRRTVLGVALAGAAAVVVVPGSAQNATAEAGTPIYGTCTGQKQGVIQGSATARGHERQIAITNLDYGVSVPRDAASGLPTGRRQYKPVSIVKRTDASSIPFANALSENENLTSCTFHFFKTDAAGRTVEYQRMVLTNASLSDHTFSGVQVGSDTETWKFIFQTITVTDLTNNKVFTDDWEQPVS